MSIKKTVPHIFRRPSPTFSFLAALCLMAPLTVATAADEDGCYFPPNDCLSVSSDWTSSGNLKLRMSNNCQAGIYVRWCVLETDGSDGCGASHIGQGRSYSSVMYNPDDSGRHAWRFVGSEQASKDWVCSGKISNWNEDMSYY
jgi:hypothetical protein